MHQSIEIDLLPFKPTIGRIGFSYSIVYLGDGTTPTLLSMEKYMYMYMFDLMLIFITPILDA